MYQILDYIDIIALRIRNAASGWAVAPKVQDYDPDQPRDEYGRWITGKDVTGVPYRYSSQKSGNHLRYYDGQGWVYVERQKGEDGNTHEVVVRAATNEEATYAEIDTKLNYFANKPNYRAYLENHPTMTEDILHDTATQCYAKGTTRYTDIEHQLIDNLRKYGRDSRDLLPVGVGDEEYSPLHGSEHKDFTGKTASNDRVDRLLKNVESRLDVGASSARKNSKEQYIVAAGVLPILRAVADGSYSVYGKDIITRASGSKAGMIEMSSIQDIVSKQLGYDVPLKTVQKAWALVQGAASDALQEGY